MLLLVLFNVRSERELLQSLPLRLDWLWLLDFDIDTPVPNHRVLSKARTRWGVAVFESFFLRVVWPCVEAGLVDGNKIFVDASFVEADASMNSLVGTGCIKATPSSNAASMRTRRPPMNRNAATRKSTDAG